ncbi:MAG TPA: tetratricopeptide repeat protein [Allosphingosinicella sp.]
MPSAATIILIIAGLIAAVAVASAVWQSGGGEAAAEASNVPGAKDWRVVGWAYLENGRPEEAAAAYRRAAEIEPANAENWSSLGEVLQSASRTVVPEAKSAFEKALKLDPGDPRARYFLAVQKDLGGDHKGAIEAWTALLKDTPQGAPWEADLRRTIERTAAENRIDLAGRVPPPGTTGSVATAGIPGPSPEQLAAASSIPPGQQDEMVQAMVQRLADRLKANPRDEDGWIRLMRSRMVLKEEAKAKEALRSGLAAFPGDSAAQARLRSAAAELGVPGG